MKNNKEDENRDHPEQQQENHCKKLHLEEQKGNGKIA